MFGRRCLLPRAHDEAIWQIRRGSLAKCSLTTASVISFLACTNRSPAKLRGTRGLHCTALGRRGRGWSRSALPGWSWITPPGGSIRAQVGLLTPFDPGSQDNEGGRHTKGPPSRGTPPPTKSNTLRALGSRPRCGHRVHKRTRWQVEWRGDAIGAVVIVGERDSTIRSWACVDQGAGHLEPVANERLRTRLVVSQTGN